MLSKDDSILCTSPVVFQYGIPDLQVLPFSHRMYSCSGFWTCISYDKSTCKLERATIVKTFQTMLKYFGFYCSLQHVWTSQSFKEFAHFHEPFRLETTYKITKSNHRPELPSPISKPRPVVPCPHAPQTPLEMGTPPLPWALHSNA